MNTLPLVTIVAVNYNFELYVLQTLESIRNQTYEHTELLIIDDHSTDNSVTLIKNWLLTYERPARLIVNEKNMGVCATLNKVFREARGKYIAATAADDILMPDKLKVQVDILESAGPDICAVYSNAYIINELGQPRDINFIERRNVVGYPQGYIYEYLLTDNFIPAMSVMLKKECYEQVGEFDEKLVYEDYDMWLRMSQKYKFIYSDYISVKYRVKDKSLATCIDWDVPNAKILLKHAKDNTLALKKLRELAFRAYSKDKKKVFDILISIKTDDRYLNRVLFLHRNKVPLVIGRRLLNLV
jgi:glycosyltransferase involved in cell wall biosynthesis